MSGCFKDNSVADKDNNDTTTEIKTGTPVNYTVSSTRTMAVKDTVSGCSFVFPEGGSGTLSVASVISGPSLEYQAKQFTVDYSGDEEVELAVKHVQNSEDVLFVYTTYPSAAVDDRTGDYTWWGIAPSEQKGDSTVFNITSYLPSGQTAKRGAESAKVVLAVSSIQANSSDADKMAAVRQSVGQSVNWWLDHLPPALAATARTHVNGDLKYAITWTTDGNCYDHSTHLIGPDAVFELKKDAGNHSIAHEVGHYMTHVLNGYNRYVEILDRMPTTWYGGIIDHGFADYVEGRRYVTEEYAYLSDYLITGTIDGNDLKNPYMSTVFGSKGPDEKDFPSFEGYGSVMLGSLMRTGTKVNSFWKKAPLCDAPVVGAPVADVLALVAGGARDTNELRAAMQNYLDTRPADRYKLPAMLEPLGWSYNGGGTVVDKSNKPVKGAHVQSISQDGAKEYRTFMSTATGDDGAFLLPRIYPGTNILRIFWNSDKDSTDVSFTADWTKPTNVTLKMGTLKADATQAPITLTLTRTSVPTRVAWGGATAEPYDVMAQVTMTATLTVTGAGIEVGQTSDNYYRINVPLNTPVSASVTATFTKTMINDHNPYGAVFMIGEPVFRPKWSNSISYSYGAAQITNKSTDTVLACDFTFINKDNGFSMGPQGEVPFQVGGDENGQFFIWTDSGQNIVGPTFFFDPK